MRVSAHFLTTTILASLLLGFCLLPAAQAQEAKTIVIQQPRGNLFSDDSETCKENTAKINSVEYGDTLVFRWRARRSPLNWFPQEQERSFQVGELLGEGKMTKVFEILGDSTRVLRTPSNWGTLKNQDAPTTLFFKPWIVGHKTLLEAGVQIPALYDSALDLFAEVERIGAKNAPDLKEFIERPEHFTEQQRVTMLLDLELFARSTARIGLIEDFHARQLIYAEGRGWFLLDWLHEIDKAKKKPPAVLRSKFAGSAFSMMYVKEGFFPSDRYDPETNELKEIRYSPNAKSWFQEVEERIHRAIADEREILWHGKDRREGSGGRSCLEIVQSITF